jgi:hypothetical protein
MFKCKLEKCDIVNELLNCMISMRNTFLLFDSIIALHILNNPQYFLIDDKRGRDIYMIGENERGMLDGSN